MSVKADQLPERVVDLGDGISVRIRAIGEAQCARLLSQAVARARADW